MANSIADEKGVHHAIALESLESLDFSHQRFAPWIESAFDAFLAFVLVAELLLLFGNTALRSLTGYSLVWANEIAEYALTSLAFIGGAIAYHRGGHLVVRFVVDALPQPLRKYAECARHYFVLLAALMGLFYIVPMWNNSWSNLTVVLQVSKSWTLIPFFAGMALTAVFAITELRRHGLRDNLVAGAAVFALGLAWCLGQYFTGPWDGPTGIAFALLLLLILVFSGVPIAYVLSVAAYIYIFGSGEADPMAVSFAMTNGISSFILLAVPFFILAGNVMTDGGLTRPLADWVTAMVGRLQGGLLQALVVAMYIFSGISGSKIADVAAVGTTLRGMLREQGYDPAESGAVLSAAGIMGETIPPSLVMMVLASITTLSVGAFFIAGVVPAALLGLCLMAIVYGRARKFDWPRCAAVSWPDRAKITIKAFPALLVPIILIVGIVGGIATTTEVSSIAVVYSLLVSKFIYRGMGARAFLTTVADSGAMAGMVLFMVSAGSAFSWTLAVSGLQTIVGNFVDLLGGSALAFMAFSIVLMAIMGSILEGLPSLLIFGPMLLHLAGNYGIDPMHFGIVIIIAMGIGTFVPPFGVCYFVTCSVMETTVEKVTPRFLPYLAVLLAGLVVIAAFPSISLSLPHAFGLR
ncbi:MAG: TRAP transporter large permease subunit [Hyphomicrobiales bacterium]|nr:TRAP transporter large permease subunit [Hyphomicrobiales bacterium]